MIYFIAIVLVFGLPFIMRAVGYVISSIFNAPDNIRYRIDSDFKKAKDESDQRQKQIFKQMDERRHEEEKRKREERAKDKDYLPF